MVKLNMANKKRFQINLAHSHQEADVFNSAFWQKAGTFARFAAAWQMVVDYHTKIKGKNGRLPRLRRSIQNIQFTRD